MKKNFLMVASLLIAAMLLVVSCSQEVKAPESDLVEASFSVGFGKDINIEDYDGTGITYVYSVTPQWSKLENGVEPFGATSGTIEGKSISDKVTEKNIGYVTPGLWKVTVEGYKGYVSESNTGTLVLKGEKSTYFTKDRSLVTVLVYPNEGGTAKVTFDLEMQDLEKAENNAINIEFFDIKGEKQGETVSLKKGVDGVNVSEISGKAAYKYVKNGENAFVLPKVGYYTVKVTVPGYEGGYVRTFLAIKDGTIAISGSVYPSKFINSSLNIVSISVDQANISISGTNTNKGTNYFTGSMVFSLNDNANTYLKSDDITRLTTNSNITDISTTTDYEWYINSKKTETGVADDYKSLTTTFAPGNYSVSCVIKYTVTFTYNDGTDEETRIFIGNAYSKEFIVE